MAYKRRYPYKKRRYAKRRRTGRKTYKRTYRKSTRYPNSQLPFKSRTQSKRIPRNYGPPQPQSSWGDYLNMPQQSTWKDRLRMPDSTRSRKASSIPWATLAAVGAGALGLGGLAYGGHKARQSLNQWAENYRELAIDAHDYPYQPGRLDAPLKARNPRDPLRDRVNEFGPLQNNMRYDMALQDIIDRQLEANQWDPNRGQAHIDNDVAANSYGALSQIRDQALGLYPQQKTEL